MNATCSSNLRVVFTEAAIEAHRAGEILLQWKHFFILIEENNRPVDSESAKT